MLVLSRKVGEEIVIGNDVIVGVGRVFRDRVALTITAPKSVRVDREEIRLAKNRARLAKRSCRSASHASGVGRNKTEGL